MTAKDLFRAKWSKKALRLWLKNPKRRGIAWRCRNKPHRVRVRWDENKYPVTYHKKFIDRVGR